jgi:transcriptional regulator with XRE-family HTH domain
MKSKASEALAAGYEREGHGAQKRHAERTDVHQTTLSRLAKGLRKPDLSTATALAADPIIPIPLEWWEIPAAEKATPKRGKRAA